MLVAKLARDGEAQILIPFDTESSMGATKIFLVS